MTETKNWFQIYDQEALKRRRLQKHRQKLKKIGILQASRENKILDLCCGQGEMLQLLASEGFQYLTGVDEMDSQYVQTTGRWKFHQQSVVQYDGGARDWDWILCAHAMHHFKQLHEIPKLLENAYQWLKPGGQLVIIDHFDSIPLRVAYGILQTPLACLTAWTKDFRKQLIEEHDYLYHYLDRWREVEQYLVTSVFKNFTIQRDLFFFYFRATK